ncbi:MAG: hypothetical protein HC811_11295 [Flammeovirgaceae bacterium]|nr:hypothetical protein [Flammeovirgaceae bacterium]
MKLRIALVLVITIISSYTCWSQLDSLRVQRDTLKRQPNVVDIDTYAARFNPRKALMYSAVLPGMGQAYNKKYWKVPIVYGGFFIFGYLINFYQDEYVRYKNELFLIINDPTQTAPSGLPEDQLRTVVDRAKRERDFYIILGGAWYLLQIVDAHVDAHLKEFDVNPQLKISLEPMMEQSPIFGRSQGVSLIIKF